MSGAISMCDWPSQNCLCPEEPENGSHWVELCSSFQMENWSVGDQWEWWLSSQDRTWLSTRVMESDQWPIHELPQHSSACLILQFLLRAQLQNMALLRNVLLHGQACVKMTGHAEKCVLGSWDIRSCSRKTERHCGDLQAYQTKTHCWKYPG